MSGYRFSPAAQVDLEAIWIYTTENWSEDQAERYIRLLEQACADLASGRRRGRSIEGIPPGYYQYAVGSHFLVYHLADSGHIDVVRLLHQRMDVVTHL